MKSDDTACNLLTVNPLPHYSGRMISDFHDLAEKISQLAELTLSLRGENAELRARALTLETENEDLARRMQEAHDRISLLLKKIPSLDNVQDEEAV